MRRRLRRPTAGASRGPSRPSISGSSPASVRASSCSRRIDSCTAAMCVDQRRSESGSRASAFSVASSAAGASEGSLTRLGSGDDVRGNQDETVASLLGGSVAGVAWAAPFGRAASARFLAGMAPHGGGTKLNRELIPFLTPPALFCSFAISASLSWCSQSLATFRRPDRGRHTTCRRGQGLSDAVRQCKGPSRPRLAGLKLGGAMRWTALVCQSDHLPDRDASPPRAGCARPHLLSP